MKLTITKERRRFFLFLPLIAIPFLCLVFHTLGGGRGIVKGKTAVTMGLNTQLPGLPVDLQKAFQDKLKMYEQADHDSVRKAEYQRRDPYRRDSVVRVHAARPLADERADQRADQLVQKLTRLRQGLNKPQPMAVQPSRPYEPRAMPQGTMPQSAVWPGAAPDPQIDRLNLLLDKVIRIQHPEEKRAVALPAPMPEEVLPADSTVNSIAAMIPEEQTLTAGATVSLRIMDSIRVEGRTVPAGEMVYGVVAINNDRLLVHVGTLREGRNLYSTDWQVYDLDGLQGMHIPGILERDVAKQSADQGVNALNVATLDPSLGAQAAGAGIQAAKTFLGRKVRQVRVTVRAGYQVLLRPSRMVDGRRGGLFTTTTRADSLEPPPMEEGGTVLAHCKSGGVDLRLRELVIKDSCLWFGLEWRNRGAIGFMPAYARWTVRDRRVFRRTALQEQPLEPMAATTLAEVAGDSAEQSFVGFRPFALARDKELVLEVGEKNGGRTLVLVIDSKQIQKARLYAKASEQ